MARSNGWDLKTVAKIAEHAHITTRDKAVDWGLHRVDLEEPAALVPDHWMEETNAIGSVEKCVSDLQRWRDAGADEIGLYGSTPAQNAELIAAWRNRDV